MGKVLIRTLLLSLLTLGISVGQLTRGFISGTVQDPSGAVVPGVAVKITNRATNVATETATNALGFYRFVAVEPGQYSVEFAKAGFETRRVEGITVGTSQEVTVNQELAVGAAATIVEVTEAPPGVELAKSSATIDRTLSQVVIQSLPLTGATRDINAAAYLAPTVARGPGSTEIAVNGNRARNNNFMVDGVDNNDISVTLQSNRMVPEAVQEYQIQTSSYSAEFGRNTGAQINVITRSGSNEFHGEAWDYYRGNWMEPLNLLNKRAGLKSTPRFNQHQFGGDFGGRIIRDRTFFFGLLELNRRNAAPDSRNSTSAAIPTPTGYAALQNVPLRPASGSVPAQAAASRQAALSALGFLSDIHAQVAGNYQNVTTQNINGVPIQIGTINIPLANPYDFWNHIARVDHRVNDGNRLSYRLQLDKRNQPDVTSNLSFGPRWTAAQTILGQNHALSLTSTLSPRLINEARFSFVRRNLDFPERDPVSPTVQIIGAFTIGGSSNFPQARVQNTFQWQDVMTAILGRHSIRFGADIRRVRLFNRSGFSSKGFWRFNSLADFINNQAFDLQQAVNEASFDARQTTQYYFVQDDIRATRDLTLNIGLRYEYQNIPFGFFGAATDQIAAALVPRNVAPDKNNWAPRFGFAYSPSTDGGFRGALFGDGKTVIRGGFGMGYDVLFYNILTVTASNYPRVVTALTTQPVDLFPTLAPRQATAPPFNPLAQFVNANSDMQNPTSHYWSLSIQREVLRGNIFEVGYTGNRGYHGIGQGRLNPSVLTPEQAATVRATRSTTSIPNTQARRLYPQFGDRVTIESNMNSAYHGTFVRFDRRFANGLVVGGNYTFSKLMSDNDESLGVADITNSSPQIPQNFFNRRADWSVSAFDVPHRFAVHYVYEIPGKNAFDNAVLGHVLGGWRISGFHEWQSGQPFGIRTGADTIGQGATNNSRPDWNASGTFQKDAVEGNYRTFTAPLLGGAFVTPLGNNGLPLSFSDHDGGNLGKNTFRGPSFAQTNFGLAKQFRITERWSFEIRNDLINAFNHRNFKNPVANMSAPDFGQNTSDPGNRTMLLSGKIRF